MVQPQPQGSAPSAAEEGGCSLRGPSPGNVDTEVLLLVLLIALFMHRKQIVMNDKSKM